MTSYNRLALFAGLASLSLALTACPGPTPGGEDGGPPVEPCDANAGDCTCVVDEDCPDPALFFCNQTTSTCQPACRSKTDCTSAVRGEFALAYCDGNLGCQCDEGTCVAALCSADVDCGANSACRNGTCVPAPTAATAQTCQITPDFAIVKAGQPVHFAVSFWAGTEPLVISSGIEWTAAAGTTRVTNAVGNGTTATFSGGTPGAAEAAVQAKAGNATCTARVVTLDAMPAAGKIRVTAVNELTGRPVTGGSILVSDAVDGSELQVALMDASGSTLVDVPKAANKRVTISAFHTDYGYLTYANYDAGTGSNDLLFALRRNQSDKLGGAYGKLTGAPQTPNVHAGVAGMSIPGAVTDLNAAQLLGFTVPTNVKIGTAIDQPNVPLPAGVYLGFSQEPPIKENVAAMGLAGVCTSALAGVADVEAAINAGDCGTRTEWVLAGDVPLGDLPIDAVTGGLDNIDFGKVLSRVLPIFKRFTSSVVRDVQFNLVPKADVDNAEGDVDPALIKPKLTGQDVTFVGLPLGFSFATKVPALPKFLGKYADGVVILGGADVKGRGVVPLGLGAAVNTETPVDALTDKQSELPAAGLVLTRMAPTHSGIEGSQYALIAIAASLQSVNDASAGIAISAVVHRLADNRLAFDPTGSAPVEITQAFLPYPENAAFNFTTTNQPGLAARTFKFTADPMLTGVNAIRVQFTDVDGRRWQVISDLATAQAGFILPSPSGTFADRTFYTGSTTGERSPLLVQALKLQTGATAISYKDFVEFNATNLDRLGDYMVAFSAIDYGRPEVVWVAPTEGGKVAPGGTIKVDVTGFKVGTAATDDGVVRVSFANGPGACTDVTISTDASMGKGNLSATLPAGCEGMGIAMTATLFNGQGQQIQPAVASTITANIAP